MQLQTGQDVSIAFDGYFESVRMRVLIHRTSKNKQMILNSSQMFFFLSSWFKLKCDIFLVFLLRWLC